MSRPEDLYNMDEIFERNRRRIQNNHPHLFNFPRQQPQRITVVVEMSDEIRRALERIKQGIDEIGRQADNMKQRLDTHAKKRVETLERRATTIHRDGLSNEDKRIIHNIKRRLESLGC